MMDKNLLAKVATAGEIAVALPAIEVVLDGLEEGVRGKVFGKFAAAPDDQFYSMDPEFAVQCWTELFYISKLRGKLRAAVAAGRSSTSKITTIMNGEDDG
jgi:hypothetical protein